MNYVKRMLAVLLTVCVTVGDCKSMTVFAAENALALEMSVSENNPIFDEAPEIESETVTDDTVSSETISTPDTNDTAKTDDANAGRNLPAIHIGQIPYGEKLPSADDDFLYDLPLSFETSEKLILFTNYVISDSGQNNSPKWSILRGEKNLAPGSTNLLQEEDDWFDFETVTVSPLFSLEEITDEESEYHQLLMLTPGAAVDDETYDYYIRAAYYPETENGKSEPFYAAVTLPFIAQKAADETLCEENTDAAETEQLPKSDSESVSENAVPDESVSENTTDSNGTEITDEMPLEEETVGDVPQETVVEEPLTEEDALIGTDSVSENSTTLQAADSQDPSNPDGQEPPQIQDSVGVLTLDAESITLHPAPAKDANFSVTATLEAKDIEAPVITWSSSDPEIAKVTVPPIEPPQEGAPAVNGKTVEIVAMKAGTTTVTAVCGNSKASVLVTVLPEDTENKEVYDLSGDLWVNGFEQESDNLVYTGQKITQDFKVYHNETLLKEKTDYTLSYRNNVNAATWDSPKAPSVTINMKGQYSGSRILYFTIKPKDISRIDANPANANDPAQKDSPAYTQVVNYAKNLSIPAPTLTYNKKKLGSNRDFTCDYSTLPANYKKGDSYTKGTAYPYTVTGKGNYTGSLSMRLIVLNKDQNFNTASVTLNAKKYAYHGTPLTKDVVKINQLKIGRTILESSLYDYDVVHTNGLQGAYINVYPTAAGEAQGYHGFKQVNLKLEADRPLNKADLIEANWQTAIPFSQKTLNEKGGMYQENETLLTFTDAETGKTDILVKDTDYTVKYSNVKKVGRVTVTFTGKGRYKGSLKKTYQITPNIENNHFTFHWKNVTKGANGKLSISYQKNGAIPDFALLDQDQNILKLKTDYKVAYKNNKIPKEADSVEMTLTVTGIGNYKGYRQEIPITVTKADIGKATLTVADKPSSTKKNAWKSAVTITDVNGKKLAAGTDYERNLIYSYPDMDNTEYPEKGTVVTVTATGCGSYQNTVSGTYRIFDSQKNINKLQVVIDPQEYTGKEITLKPADIHIYANAKDKRDKIELPNKEACYEIIGYQNNIKSGNGKVTLHGIGEYGGTKTYSFKIQKKAYVKNSVNGITVSPKELRFSLLAKEANRTLTATLTPKDSTLEITNPTVIWSTSDSRIATVKSAAIAKDAATNTVTVSAVITALKQGTVTITASTQDGNKKAQCKITVTLPTLKQKGQTIEGNAGDTYQLSFDGFDENDPMDTDGITFTSSNENIASVDGNGLITMKKVGFAGITVSMKNVANQKCAVVVSGEIDPTDSRVLTYEQEPGCTDDTDAINKLLQKWEDEVTYQHINKYDYLYIPAGEYHIDPAANPGFTAGIMLRNNQSLMMSPDAKLYAKPTNSQHYRIIYVSNRENVYISGGQLIGDKGGGEHGNGIEIVGCTNVLIRGVEVSNCHGDGIYLSRSNEKYNDGVTITGCNLHHNKRSNLSITETNNVTVENCDFNYAGGLAPHCGINIEPNHGCTCSNIKISNSRFQKNKGETIQMLGQVNAHVKGVTIENCKGDKKPLQWQGFGGSVSGVKEINNNWNWNGN